METKTANVNYHGVLNHNGTVMVAKTAIYGKIKNIQNENVLVQCRNKSFTCQIHKDLKNLMEFVENGDTGFVKFRNGNCYLVGFRKQNADNYAGEDTGDKPVSENKDWSRLV